MKKRDLEKGELGFVAVLGIFSILCLVASAQMFFAAPALNSEGTVPLFTSVVLLAMTVVMLFEMRACPRGFSAGVPLVQKSKELAQFLFPGQVGPIVVYSLLYAGLLGLVGFSISTFAFLAGSMLTLDRRKKAQSLIVSVIALVCILVVFQSIFKVQLP